MQIQAVSEMERPQFLIKRRVLTVCYKVYNLALHYADNRNG